MRDEVDAIEDAVKELVRYPDDICRDDLARLTILALTILRLVHTLEAKQE